MNNPNIRLEAFSDGVFSIAITLLIIEIKVPAADTINASHTLAHSLTEHWPSWFAFLLSFGTLLIAWVNHHNALKLINKSSSLFNFANGLFLLTIVVMPYPTSLLAEFINTESAPTAIIFYCLTIVLHNISWTLLFQSMLKPKDLSKNTNARKFIYELRLKCIYGFIAYFLISVLTFWFPLAAITLIAALWFVWIAVGISIHEEAFETV